MNKENFQKIIDAIEANKEDYFDMAHFHSSQGCGTVMCVAGFAAMLARKEKPEVLLDYSTANTFLGFPNKLDSYDRCFYHDFTNDLYYANSIEKDHWNAGDHGRRGYIIISENYQRYALDALKWMLKNDNYNWKDALTALEVYDPKNNFVVEDVG